MEEELAGKPKYPVVLSTDEIKRLEELIATKSASEWQVKRASILVALNVDEEQDTRIAANHEVGRNALREIRKRFQNGGVDAVLAMHGPGGFRAGTGGSKPRISPEEAAEAKRLHDEGGLSYRAIAKQFSYSHEAIRQAIKRTDGKTR